MKHGVDLARVEVRDQAARFIGGGHIQGHATTGSFLLGRRASIGNGP